ncbi:MAG: ABC transporter permease [Ruminococcus sp.]|nr:ABC transporter permease [Ruminococcus sp.]MEE1319211.1 ABC transporter permease [Ruminococcus sp.]
MGAILKRELSSYFNSATAYVVMAVFFLFSGLFFYNTCFLYNTTSLAGVYGNMFIIILFLVPIITMKTFSEEKRQKTDQALLTSPSSLTEIVMGKFLGAFVLYTICCCIFLLYAIVISFFAAPDWTVILCTFFGIELLGASLIAMNVFISCLTESMIIAAVAGLALGLVISMMSSLINMISVEWITFLLEKINFVNYYTNFTYGILSITDIMFFLSVTGLFLFFTVRALEKKRWS